MVKSCCVKSCRSIMNKQKKIPGVSFHLFPRSNSEILSKWVEFLNYGNDWKPLKSSSVCSLHFLDVDFRLGTNLRMLKTTAVPSVNINTIAINTTTHVSKIEPQEINDIDEIQSGDDFGICRLCSLEFKFGLNNIFDSDNNFPFQIFKCLHLAVSPNDMLPQFICYACQQKLTDSEHFIDDVMKAQETLNNKNILILNETVDGLSFNLNETAEENYPNYEFNTISSKISGDEVANNYHALTSSGNPSISIIPIEFSKPENYSTSSTIRNDIPRDLLNPIKLEITSNREILGKNQQVSNNIDRLNKKIEILEDIKIEPPLNQIAYKSFKSIYDESLSTMNRNNGPKVVPQEIPMVSNPTVPKKKVSIERNKLPSKSTVVCHYCKEKFISKYALNHHVKHLCLKKEIHIDRSTKNIKIISKSNSEINTAQSTNNNSQSICHIPSLETTRTQNKRKALLTPKSEYY